MTSQTPWYKEFWPWFIVALTVAVVIACIVTIRLALKYDDAPAEGSYQKQGLGIVATLETDEKVARDSVASPATEETGKGFKAEL